jgi:hypothetical protein
MTVLVGAVVGAPEMARAGVASEIDLAVDVSTIEPDELIAVTSSLRYLEASAETGV